MARTNLIAPALALTALLSADSHVTLENEAGVCLPQKSSTTRQTAFVDRDNAQKHDAHIFGTALARAAHRQTRSFVVYNEKYISISYPMGDVPALYGVCTDVVIRAYRELGIDLQQLVHKSRIGNGDKSINHRRVKTLKSFFKRYASSLKISKHAEDYAPGDIITYHRPRKTGMRMHIGIVADVKAPSGRPMLIHNRGHGPQIEDALFFDEITGHFRYTGPGHPKRGPTIAAARPEPTQQ